MVYFYSEQKAIFQEKSDQEELEIQRVSSLQSIVSKLQKEKILALDTETNGLNPLVHKVLMLQFGTETDQYVIDVRGIDISIFKPLFEKDILFVGQNLKFDYNMLKRYNIYVKNIYDTMLAEMILENGKFSMKEVVKNKAFSLKSLCQKYLDISIGKEVRDEFSSWGNAPFTISQILYGAKDVIFPLQIRNIQKVLIERYELKKTLSLECKAVLSLADIEYNGIYLDSEKWIEANDKMKLELKQVLIDLDKILIEKDLKYKSKLVQLNLFSDVFQDEYRRLTYVNWDSPLQVIKILTEIFDIYPKDKYGKLSSGKKALEGLDTRPPIVKTLLRFRVMSKAVNSFGARFLREHRHSDGRIRTTFNSIVETGRVSSRKPNMQQIPSDKSFRSCFTAAEGKNLIIADYSNQEGRIMADRSGDKSYIDFFNNGDGDAHSFIARTMFSAAEGKFVDVQNDENHPNYHLRQKGKILNFFISFGGSAYTLSSTLKIPLEESEYLIENFYKGFPGLKVMFDENANVSLDKGYIRTNSITNRIRWMRGWKRYQELTQRNKKSLTKDEFSEMSKIRGSVRRRGMNTPIQGTAGDMTKTALILIRNKLLQNGIIPFGDAPIKIVNVIHDEIVIEALIEFTELAVKILQESMETAGNYFVNRVNMSAKPVISKYWNH